MRETADRIVWMLWLQGWDTAPPLVQACRRSWQRENPDWDVRLLDAGDVADVLGSGAPDDRFPAAQSDIVRAHLLSRHGGVWADATTFCMKPLDEWLPVERGQPFFAFASPGYGRMLSTWFLAARPGSVVMSQWSAQVDRYWANRTEPDQYFWFHGLFARACSVDHQARREWREGVSIPAAGPHYFSPYSRRFVGPMTRRARSRLAARADPVYKLTTRADPATAHPESALVWFLDDGRLPLEQRWLWVSVDRVLTTTAASAKSVINAGRLTFATWSQRVRSGSDDLGGDGPQP